MAWTLKIGNVFLPYSAFEWPKYRGTVARIVEIDCPAEYFSKLEALAKSLQGKPTSMTFTAPSSAGANASEDSRTINGVYITRVVKMNEAICRLFLADRRWVLSRFVTDGDYNERFGDGYLNETRAALYGQVLRKMIESQSDVDSALSVNNFITTPAPDGLHQSGLAYPQGIGEVIERSGGSLAVWNDGYMRIVDRSDLASGLPGINDYSWQTEPSWATQASWIGGRPRRIYVYYLERHCLRMQGAGYQGSIAHSGPQELRVELEQVYKGKYPTGTVINGVNMGGKTAYVTLEELLTSNGFAATDLTDAEIANCYMSSNFERATNIYSELDNDATKAVISAVHDGWRQLWRVKFVGVGGAIGGWTDWAFGKINPDGSVLPVTVECPWVEFLDAPAPSGGGKDFIGTVTTINHASPAPFEARWEGGDPSLGIIRLHQRELESGNIAVPGALVAQLGIKRTSQLKDAKGKGYTIDGFDGIESEDRGMAQFQNSFTIAIYACATRRMPNNETKWHRESVDGFADGDIDYIELPVGSELYCVRDYVSASESGKLAQADGLGRVLNADALEDDAQVRADVWKTMFTSPFEGFGIAEGIKALDIEVQGPIAEVVLEVGQDEIRTRVVAGNLADNLARERIAQKRLADRKFKTAGGF